ncbi:helix-turn-helix domain-containing protein [Verrucomicrobium spinosum]|uniref:helix-turn-helix domain-containing protein n=1 Tax=Verrucomicrobium spinosum TaxID=2736 RepID=UPI0001744340|nr:helix-turn-helix domain-containing protein [Verrucomicrobium spinosum]
MPIARRTKKPCKTVRQIREAAGKSQSEFAEDVDVSVAYVQAIEQGARPASREFAIKVMGRYGAWWECVADNWEQAIDLSGRPYTSRSYADFCEDVPENLSDHDVEVLVAPVRKLVKGAAMVGKTRLVALWLHLVLVDGFKSLRNVEFYGCRSTTTKLTYGRLREDKGLAAALNFTDAPSVQDDVIAMEIHTPGDSVFGREYPDLRDLSSLVEKYGSPNL